MVQSPKNSPNRRRSIAVLGIEKSQASRRRRAHSIAPGDKLSPYARSRRSLGPRKSILKAAPPRLDEDVTQAMELTTIQTALSRRVSFAESAHVRLFQVQEQNTNSTGTPPSSPPTEDPPVVAPPLNDENAYPGAKTRSRRRSSLRRSFGTDIGAGEESMELDMDSIAHAQYAPFPDEEGFIEGEGENTFDDQEDFGDGDDMELTEIIRRRSMAEARRRSSMGTRSQLPLPEDVSQPGSDMSQSVDESYEAQHEEFMMPLGKSLREPSPPPDVWHELRAMTHAGNLPASDTEQEHAEDDSNMNLGDAMNRLRAARDSLGLVGLGDYNDDEQDNSDGGEDHGFKDVSFASTNSDSFEDDIQGAQDKTVNLTEALHRASFGVSSQETVSEFSSQKSRTSNTDTADARINNTVQPPTDTPNKPQLYPDLSEFAPTNQSTPSTASVPVFQKSTSTLPFTVFSRPPAAGPSTTATPKPTAEPLRPSVFSTKPLALPSTSPELPKVSAPDQSDIPEPLKRPLSATGPNAERPSPAKKQATSRLSVGGSSRPTPGIPSPRKPGSPVKGRVPSAPGMRRTSVTFSQRKSLGGGPSAAVAFGSRVGGKTMGRKSAPGEIASPVKSKASLPSPAVNRSGSPAPASPGCEREALRQAVAIPSTSRGSPMPESPRVVSPLPQSPQAPLAPNDPAPFPQDDQEPAGEEATKRWREEAQDDELLEDDDGPLISIEQFLAMTGVKFMDELAAPRRSTILPSQLAASVSSDAGGDVPLADYVVAMAIDLPQWILYAGVSADLQGMVDGIKDFYKVSEKEVEKDVPALFREFAGADDDLKEELLHQLKLIKAQNHALARSQWYDWKMFWVGQFHETAEKAFVNLESDATKIERIIKEAQEIIPTLKEEYEAVIKESEKEAEEVAEIEQCDQEYLNELKTSIAEQSSELDVFRAEVAETRAKLERLKESSAEIEAEKKAARAAIADCERRIQIQKSSTKDEVFQLKEKLDAIQELHHWRPKAINSEMVQFVYASRYIVSIPCIAFTPISSGVTISRIPPPQNKRPDPFPQLSELALKSIQSSIATMKETTTIHQIIQRLGDFWTSMVQLRAQFDVLAIRFPVNVECLTNETSSPAFKAVISALFPKFKAKALINFIFDFDTFSNWPMSIALVQCEVDIAYGTLNQETIRTVILDHLSAVSLENLHGCLLDACVEAVEQT